MTNRQTWLWWPYQVVVSLAPWVGLSLSPLALFSLVGQWHDWPLWVTPLTELWAQTFRPPIDTALGWIFALLRVEAPPAVLDYIAMGVISVSMFYRAADAAKLPADWEFPGSLGGNLIRACQIAFAFALLIAIWPVLLVLMVALPVLAMTAPDSGNRQAQTRMVVTFSGLCLAPFGIVLGVWSLSLL